MLIATQKKGLMDAPLWHDFIRYLILPLYHGKLSKEVVRDPMTKNYSRAGIIPCTQVPESEFFFTAHNAVPRINSKISAPQL